ncbi:putative bifunctional diguanylate cyclase/phosphodiesterase [Motiliproteus coralliicola]|uniref:putative bifunctional diguanylate cyclase/phosphodiesterase n=1 Tax=Motiliproteus coralliicola TaxID=2283196 RepID=UPI001403DA9A|nr:bifunctional diguanylate cyclase/phosphodiesterase [Motiliproteus coralliicola]
MTVPQPSRSIFIYTLVSTLIFGLLIWVGAESRPSVSRLLLAGLGALLCAGLLPKILHQFIDRFGRHPASAAIDSPQPSANALNLTIESTPSQGEIYLDQAQALILVLDHEGRVEYLNQYGYRLLGYPQESLTGREWLKLCVPASEHKPVLEALEAYHKRNQLTPLAVEHPVLTAEGKLRLIAWNCRSVALPDGCRQLLCSGLDVTENRRTQNSLEKLSCAVEQSSTSVLIFDRQGRIEYVNPAFSLMSGYNADEVIGRKPRFLESPDTERKTLLDLRATILRGENWQGEICYRRKDGQHFWVRARISPIKDEQGHIDHYVSVTEDITDARKHQMQIERMAFQDPLTQLPNRRGFHQQLQQMLEECDEQQQTLILYSINLDHFKRINDSLGHNAGDQLLCRTAKMLKKEITGQDLLGRLSSDEFLLALRNVNHDQATQFGKRINRLLRQPLTSIGGDSRRESGLMTASIGIASFPEHARDTNELIKCADLAMQNVKQHDRNGYRFFSARMKEALEADLFLERELQRALQNDEFELYYQPQVDLQLGCVSGLEALLRWKHPQRGLIAPDTFISVAERSGLIIPLGQLVLRKACRSYQILDLLGLGHLRIAINLSALQFRDPLFPRTFQQIMTEHQVNPAQIELELTESMLMTNIEEAIMILDQLKQLGATLAIDDFGTGYSSLSYLKRLPVDIIKVDRAFVKDIPDNENDMEITAAVIAMAHKLKRKVVAEGVETLMQEQFLRDNDCDYLQGYRYSPPLPESELTSQIARIDLELGNSSGNGRCIQLEFDS